MIGDVSTSLDDWFGVLEERGVCFTRADRVLLEAMALSRRTTQAEIIRQAVRNEFLRTWPGNAGMEI